MTIAARNRLFTRLARHLAVAIAVTAIFGLKAAEFASAGEEPADIATLASR